MNRAEQTIRENPCHPWFENVFFIDGLIFPKSHAPQYRAVPTEAPLARSASRPMALRPQASRKNKFLAIK